MTNRSSRERRKRHLHERCAELSITVAESATVRQLETAIDAYERTAAVVRVGDDVDIRQTDRPTAEYTIHFTITGSHTVEAESEEAARKWVEDTATYCYRPTFGDADMGGCEIHEVFKVDEN